MAGRRTTRPADPGFQADFSTLWVDDNSPQIGTIGRIQEAIGLVSGSTVTSRRASTPSNVVIDKTMSVLGAGGGSDPAACRRPTPTTPRPGRTGITIQAGRDGPADRCVIRRPALSWWPDGIYTDCTLGLPDAGQNLTQSPARDRTASQVLNCVLGPNTNTAAQDGDHGTHRRDGLRSARQPVKLIVMHNKVFDSTGNGWASCSWDLRADLRRRQATIPERLFAGTVIEDNDILGNHRSGIEFAGGVRAARPGPTTS